MPVSPVDLEALLARAEEHGCVAESEIAQLVEQLTLDEDEVNDLHAALESRGIEVTDDCARTQPGAPEQVSYTHTELAAYTTDAVQQFLNEAGRHRLLTPQEELDLANRIEKGDLE